MDALSALEREGAKLVDAFVPYAEHAGAVGVLTIGPECSGGVTDDLAAYGSEMSDYFVLSLNLLGHTMANEFVCAQRTRASATVSSPSSGTPNRAA